MRRCPRGLLTLGALLAASSKRRSVKIFWISLAIVYTTYRISRVYLGVHHPSDVLAGWLAGAAWAMFAFLLARLFKYRLHQDVDHSSELLSG